MNFSLNPNWTSEQLNVLNSEPGIIVRGIAGSGKSLLAIHIALKRVIDYNERVLLLVFTKTVDRLIEDYISNFSLPSNKLIVMFHAKLEYIPIKFINPDVIIVDEFQDFTDGDLKALLGVTNKLYFLGDDDQIVQEKQYGSRQEVINQEYLMRKTKFPILYITQNQRNKNGIKLLSQLYLYHLHKNEELPDSIFTFYQQSLSEIVDEKKELTF